jgi:hypothetical protein
VAARETAQARQAALLVHGLPPSAQRRILTKLDAAHTARLRPLLAELVRLGVPQALGQQLQQGIAVPPASIAPGTAPRERVRSMVAADIVHGLKPCAAVTVAHLLRAEEWPWKQQALACIPEPRRTEVLRHLHQASASLAPAVLTALCERLCKEVALLNAECARTLGPPASAENSIRRARPGGIRQSLGRLLQWIR